MCVLLNLPKVPADSAFYHGPSIADDEYPVEDILPDDMPKDTDKLR